MVLGQRDHSHYASYSKTQLKGEEIDPQCMFKEAVSTSAGLGKTIIEMSDSSAELVQA